VADDQGAIHYLGAVPVGVGPYEVWQLYGLDELWEMVRDEDGVASFTQVGAWHRMAELCSEQADQLQRALDQLMVHWPARPGSAAELFQQTLGRLIGSMRDSAAVAASTKQPLADITITLGRAKDEIGALVAQEALYAGQEQALAGRGVYPGRGATANLAPSDQTPPAGWREQLDERARRIMSTADAKVGAAATQIQIPERYRIDAHAEAIEPYRDPTARGSARQPSTSLVAGLFPAFDPPQSDRSVSDGRPAESVDPVLDGGLAPAVGSVGGVDVVGGSVDVRGGGSFVASQFGPVLAPGGVIGVPGVGGSGGGLSGRSGLGRVVGSASGGGPMVGPVGRGVGGVRGGSGSGSVRSGGRRRRRSDPADPWAVPQGGPSVLEPDPEPAEHDPGPGVIGLDR
jgi:hypothetical protein